MRTYSLRDIEIDLREPDYPDLPRAEWGVDRCPDWDNENNECAAGGNCADCPHEDRKSR